MTGPSRLSSQVRWRLCAYGRLMVIGGLLGTLTADSVAPTSDEILARIESETNRRHVLLKEYSGSRQYTLQNPRFGKRAAVDVMMNYRQAEGERYTVLTRSGSNSLNGVIDKVLASESGASLPPENALHQISSANYRVRLLGTEVAAGRSCYVLELSPKIKSKFLIAGKAWVDADSYGVVRLERPVRGQQFPIDRRAHNQRGLHRSAGFLAARARAVHHIQSAAWPDQNGDSFFELPARSGSSSPGCGASKQRPDARSRRHGQGAPKRDADCAQPHVCASRAPSQRAQKRQEQQ